MSALRNLLRFFLVVGILAIIGSEKLKLSEIQNTHHLIHERNYVTHHETHKRQNNKNCPPPPGQGILQVMSDKLDVFPTNKNKSAMDNLRFMCGQTQITLDKTDDFDQIDYTGCEKSPEYFERWYYSSKQEKKRVPIGWEMQTQHDGSVKNVTLYTSALEFIPLCCPGYVRNLNDICVPKCKGDCKDGVCVSPGNCACYQGYAENSLGECALTCPCKCPHGKCQGDSCICDAGYAPDLMSRTCNPVCPERCENADCTAPGVCTCRPGYKRRKTDEDYFCSPDCGTNCKHGKCVAPNVCECNEGYQKSESGACVPRCAGCEHGDCVKPFKCICHVGYERIGEECEAICDFQCHNGTCIAPNTCGCMTGFAKVSTTSCVPECKPACRNADCVAPNQCHCHKYYYKKATYLQNICFHTSFQLLSTAAELANDLNNKF